MWFDELLPNVGLEDTLPKELDARAETPMDEIIGVEEPTVLMNDEAPTPVGPEDMALSVLDAFTAAEPIGGPILVGDVLEPTRLVGTLLDAAPERLDRNVCVDVGSANVAG